MCQVLQRLHLAHLLWANVWYFLMHCAPIHNHYLFSKGSNILCVVRENTVFKAIAIIATVLFYKKKSQIWTAHSLKIGSSCMEASCEWAATGSWPCLPPTPAHFNFSSTALPFLPHLDCVKRNCFRTTFSWTILRSNFHISPGLEKFCTDSVHSLWCSNTRCTLSGLRHSHLRRLCLALKQLLTE